MKIIYFEVKRHIQRFLTVIVILLVVFVFEYINILDPLKNAINQSLNSVYEWNSRVVRRILFPIAYVDNLFNQADQIQELKLQLAETSANLTELQNIEEEYDELKKIVANTDRRLDDQTIITSPLLSYGNPAVAAGSQDGVKSDNVVMYKETLLGLITEVELSYSLVELLTSSSVNPVLAVTDSGVEGLVQGNGKRVLLTEVPVDQPLKVGEKVMTLGQKGLEKGLFIGRISEIIRDDARSTQSAFLEQYINFYQCDLVEIE